MPFNLKEFQEQVSDAFNKGVRIDKKEQIYKWMENYFSKIILSIENSTKSKSDSTLVITTEQPSKIIEQFLKDLVNPLEVVVSPRKEMNDYAIILKFPPRLGKDWTFSDENWKNYSAEIHNTIDLWEEAVIEKWTLPIMEALEKGSKKVIYNDSPPRWALKLFENQLNFNLTVKQITGINKFQVNIDPIPDTLLTNL